MITAVGSYYQALAHCWVIRKILLVPVSASRILLPQNCLVSDQILLIFLMGSTIDYGMMNSDERDEAAQPLLKSLSVQDAPVLYGSTPASQTKQHHLDGGRL